MVAGMQGASDNLQKVQTAPASLFAWFDNNGIPRKQGRDDGRDEIVEGIVPADAGGNDTKGFIQDSV